MNYFQEGQWALESLGILWDQLVKDQEILDKYAAGPTAQKLAIKARQDALDLRKQAILETRNHICISMMNARDEMAILKGQKSITGSHMDQNISWDTREDIRRANVQEVLSQFA